MGTRVSPPPSSPDILDIRYQILDAVYQIFVRICAFAKFVLLLISGFWHLTFQISDFGCRMPDAGWNWLMSVSTSSDFWLLTPDYCFCTLKTRCELLNFCHFRVSIFRLSPRPISIRQLHALLHFHTGPIYLIISEGSYWINSMGNFILRGASRLDAFSAYPFHT